MKIKQLILLTALFLGLGLQVRASTNLVNGFYVISNPAPTVTVSWSSITNDANLSGYNIYWGTASGQYSTMVHAGATNLATVAFPALGRTYFIAATTQDSNGLESAFSNEISVTFPAGPQSPTLQPPVILTVQRKINVQDFMWADTGLSWPVDPSDTSSIFQLKITKGTLLASAVNPARVMPSLPPLPGQ